MAKLGDVIAILEDLSSSGALGATEDALQAEQNATDVAEGNAEYLSGKLQERYGWDRDRAKTEVSNFERSLKDPKH